MKYFTFLGFFLFFLADIVFAQEFGSIRGNVNDDLTNSVLQEAQLYIEGEPLGDVSDYAGNYEIRNVKPGVYNITALMIGYEKVSKKNIRVTAGEVTTINFSLNPTIYESAGKVVVTATKMEKEIKDIPASVYLVSGDDIKQAEMRNVETMLQKIPGVFTEDRFHSEYNVVSFRGVGLHSHVTRGILVLIDGISINEAMGRVDFEGIDLGNIEKIEVLKGPVSALYGPNGITGVINIVTKKAPEKFESKIESSFGAYDLRKFTMSAGGKIGQYGVYFSASDHSTNGYRDRNSYNADKFAAKLQTDYERMGNMMLSLDYIRSDTDFPGSLSKEQFEARETANENKFAGSKKEFFRLGVTHKKHFSSGFDLNSNLFFRNCMDEGGYNDTFTSEDDINLYGGEIRLQRSFFIRGKRNSLIGGITAERENGDSETFDLDESGVKTEMTDKGTSIYDIYGYYLQNDFQISNPLMLSFGLRYDRVHYDWDDRLPEDGNTSDVATISAWSPKLALTYNPFRALTIYTNVGKGFNPPQISQLFIGGYGVVPNPDLKSEYLTNYEIGVRGDISGRFDYQVSFFMMNFADQIIQDEVSGMYENVGETRHNGAEFAGNVKLSNSLILSVNYAYLDARFDNSPSYNDNYLRKTPRHQAGADLRFVHSSGLSTDISWKWIDKYYMDNENVHIYGGYGIVNTKLSYEMKHYYASVSVNNVFDTNYATWAYASFSRGVWSESYYPGYPVNVTITAGLKF